MHLATYKLASMHLYPKIAITIIIRLSERPWAYLWNPPSNMLTYSMYQQAKSAEHASYRTYAPNPSICLFTALRTFLMDRDENHEGIFTWIAVVVVPVLFILTRTSHLMAVLWQGKPENKWEKNVPSYKCRDLNNPLCCHCNTAEFIGGYRREVFTLYLAKCLLSQKCASFIQRTIFQWYIKWL